MNHINKITTLLSLKKKSFHTFQLKQHLAYGIVIKGLHHSTIPQEIADELTSKGHPVRSIINIRHRVSKQPLAMFFVDLEPQTNNKDLYALKHINNAIVKVEPPKEKKNDLVQCYRCQQFGHTKSYCSKPYQCVKCGLDHPTAN